MTEIVWNKNINADTKKLIEKHLNPFLWLVPQWCQLFFINVYDSDSSEDCLRMLCEEDYRRLTLSIYTNYLNTWEEMQGVGIVHELIHGFTGIVNSTAEKGITAACGDNEILRDVLVENLRRANESQTQDLAYAIFNKFEEKN